MVVKETNQGDTKKKIVVVKKKTTPSLLGGDNKDGATKIVKKSDNLGSGSDSFFGGLGFKKQEQAPTKKPIKLAGEDKKEKQSASPIPTPSTPEGETNEVDDFFTQASQIAKRNAVVVRSDHTSDRSRHRSSGDKRSNISFGSAKHKEKPKKTKFEDKKGNVQASSATRIQAKKVIKEAAVSESLIKKETITVEGSISVKEFSEKSGIPLPQILRTMLANKIPGGINSVLDFDTVSLIALDFHVEVKQADQQLELEKVISGDFNAILEQDRASKNAVLRAPIVTVMGHVDHGKTSLLDYLRQTTIAHKESGGITQSIGASMVKYEGYPITFIDTPGHELFTSLRLRGAKTTNIVVIVVAIDDGLKPQTIESINHAKEAGAPIIIAITKIDKINNTVERDQAVERIKSEIGNYGLIAEDRGGDVPLIPLSSKTREGINELLEQLILQAEVLELKYDPTRAAIAVVIDARKDSKQGVLTSLIVLSGTLKLGDIVVVHNTYGKVRRMNNFLGETVTKVQGGEPVQILGITEIPEPGRIVEVVKDEREAQERVEHIRDTQQDTKKSSVVSSFLDQMKQQDTAVLKLICKADGPSSLEAMQKSLETIPLPKGVSFKIIHSGIGDVTESDITLAQASDALILGYNISASSSLKKRAESERISIKIFDIIYTLNDYIDQVLKGMVEKEYREVERGKLEILGIFYKKEKTMIIGGKVLEGKISNGMSFKVYGEEEKESEEISLTTENSPIITGTITSLQREQNSVNEVTEGYECGMKVKVSKKLTEHMILVFYEMEEITENT